MPRSSDALSSRIRSLNKSPNSCRDAARIVLEVEAQPKVNTQKFQIDHNQSCTWSFPFPAVHTIKGLANRNPLDNPLVQQPPPLVAPHRPLFWAD